MRGHGTKKPLVFEKGWELTGIQHCHVRVRHRDPLNYWGVIQSTSTNARAIPSRIYYDVFLAERIFGANKVKHEQELMHPQSNSNVVMGSEEDPKDGGAVAGAVFGAVFIYIVRII